MSTLITENLQDSGGSVPVATVREGSLRAWANINGTGTIAARDSFNVSSLVDDGVGLYGFNFTAAMNSINYPVSAMSSLNRRAQYRSSTFTAAQATTVLYLTNTDSGTTPQDDQGFNMMAGNS